MFAKVHAAIGNQGSPQVHDSPTEKTETSLQGQRHVGSNGKTIGCMGRNEAVKSSLPIRQVEQTLQFRGVSDALSSTSMQNGYFGGGVGQKMQNSFYPKRSGDIVINLMPGWIEEDSTKVSTSGSLYDYDTHVPLIFYGTSLPVERVYRNVSMTDVAPTLARIMQITVPNAATGTVLTEVIPDQH